MHSICFNMQGRDLRLIGFMTSRVTHRPRTRSVAARQVSNTHERDLVTNENILFVTRPRSWALLASRAATDLVRGRCIASSTSDETKTFCFVACTRYEMFFRKAFGNCIADINDIHEKHFCCNPKLVRDGEHAYDALSVYVIIRQRAL